jgi:hypothetical protein
MARKKSRPVKAKVPVREHKDERKEKAMASSKKKKGGKRNG